MEHCKFGCGKEAKYPSKTSNGELVWCEKHSNSCFVNKQKNSMGIKKAALDGRMIGWMKLVGKRPWNKGLTKETDVRIKNGAERYSENIKNGSRVFCWQGKKHTEETKEKISKARMSFLEKNPDKVPYIINHSSKKSYPERLFEEALIKNNISGWEYSFRNGIYCYDFAFVDKKIDVEIDGGTHLSEKVKKIDERRDIWSKSNGWEVLRFTAEEVKKNIDDCIEKLKKVIGLQADMV